MLYQCKELSFQVLSVGLFSHKDGEFYVKERPFAALSYRLSGNAEFTVGEKRLSVRQGDLLFIPANTPYRVEYLTSESIVLHLADCDYGEAERMAVQDWQTVESRFLQMLTAWRDTRAAHQVKSYVYDVLARLDRDASDLPTDPDFAACMRQIREQYRDPALSVEEICRQSHISHSGLQRRFLRYCGMSAKQYILRLRMELALELLMGGEHSVKSIAYACGFTDEKYFSRVFKSRYGVSPVQLLR